MPTIINFEAGKVKLTDFMKAIGQPEPVKKDGNIWIYNAPYVFPQTPTMEIDIERNRWNDPINKVYGNIYDLAYELTGTCNRSDLNYFVATQMSTIQKIEIKHEPDTPKQRKFRM